MMQGGAGNVQPGMMPGRMGQMGPGMMPGRMGQWGQGIMQGGMGQWGPGMMPGGMGQTGPGMMLGGMGQTGPGMMPGGMGQWGPGMMPGGMGQWGPGMMQGGAESCSAALFGPRVTPMMNLSVDDVRAYLEAQLSRLNKKRLKVGEVKADDKTIAADIVTVDNSLVQRLTVDRRTGAIKYED